jgi:hypothetical protein
MSQLLAIPELFVPCANDAWDIRADIVTWNWGDVPALPPFRLAENGALAEQQTVARVCYDAWGLYVRFDCADRDIWGTFTRRDEPIYDEEVVEVFLSPGSDTPTRYYEFEVSPNGVLLDALIDNPTSRRADLGVDFGWDCDGLRWHAVRDDAASQWWAALAIPWAAVAPPGERPAMWRANFYRIERPRDAAPEYSCWSPTMTNPADFHKPAFFGTLYLE